MSKTFGWLVYEPSFEDGVTRGRIGNATHSLVSFILSVGGRGSGLGAVALLDPVPSHPHTS